MAIDAIAYDVTFRDFKSLQGYMARRVFAKNRRAFGPALLGVVTCACFLTMIIFISANPYRLVLLFGLSIRYPLSFYLLVILCLGATLLCLIPAIRLRFKMLRLQVSDEGPLLGPTKLIVEQDGLAIDRRLIKSKYLWAAFQGVEMSKNAVILPLDSGIGVIVPASAFQTDAERHQFASVISKHIQNQKAHAP